LSEAAAAAVVALPVLDAQVVAAVVAPLSRSSLIRLPIWLRPFR
jgi:hypothetical protein